MSLSFRPIGNKCNSDALAEFETQRSIKLPADYRQFLIEYNGGVPSKRGLFLKGCGTSVTLDVLYGIHEEPGLDMRFSTEEWKDEMPEGFIVIGGDPGGAMFILGTSSEPGIYYWDHQHALPGSSEELGNTFYLSETFTELLELVHE